MPRLKPHPALAILPSLTEQEIERACDRVRLYGQTQPVAVLDAMIIGGIEEYEGCVGAGIKPTLTRINRPACAVEYVVRHLPRNLTSLDRAVVAVLAEETYKALGRERMREAGRIGGKAKGSRTVPEPFGHENWYEVAARVVGTTPGAVKRLATLRRSAPDVFDAVRERKLVILREARDLAHALKSPKARARVLALKKNHPGVPVGRLVADVMRSERPPVEGTPIERGERWVVYEGPLAQESRRIAPRTIDLVHCDIVYGDVAMANEVAKIAKRVLVDDGLLAMIAGHNVLDVMNVIAKHLNPVAIGSYHVKGNTKRKWAGPIQRIDAFPVLIFGRVKVRQVAHLAYVSEVKEAEWRGWQKNTEATLQLIAAMAAPGSRVFDPCCGSGTTGVAALRHGCEFVGIDVAPDAVKTTRSRLAQAEGERPPSAAVPSKSKRRVA